LESSDNEILFFFASLYYVYWNQSHFLSGVIGSGSWKRRLWQHQYNTDVRSSIIFFPFKWTFQEIKQSLHIFIMRWTNKFYYNDFKRSIRLVKNSSNNVQSRLLNILILIQSLKTRSLRALWVRIENLNFLCIFASHIHGDMFCLVPVKL